MKSFEYIIIGSGQGGTPLASALTQTGKKTALVESTHVGGTCVNEGCTPTKTMVASARAAYLARRGTDYGINTGNITIDTGTGPAVPSLEGVEQVPYLDSTSIMELGEVPEHLLVIGGGYIGLEFGQMFRRFGSKVTIVHRGNQLLSREDQDIAEEVLKILREDGTEVHLQSRTVRVEQEADGAVSLFFEENGEVYKVTGSHLLMAAGRKPNTDALNLEAAGVQTNRYWWIQRTSKSWALLFSGSKGGRSWP